jgi:hypothetical protein
MTGVTVNPGTPVIPVMFRLEPLYFTCLPYFCLTTFGWDAQLVFILLKGGQGFQSEY